MKAVILAGGKGTRLRPYTTNFPKPLMPIGDRPILEIVIKRLKEYNIEDIIITTGHLGELIKAFFSHGEKYGVNIKYSKEEKPLGTAGPLNLIKKELTETFLIMNGDILCDINFKKFLSFHKKNNNIATIALSKRKVNIDFGVVNISKKNKSFINWKEKPTIEYYVSTGIYILENTALKFLPEGGFFNIPDFIENINKENKKISGYIHEGYWLDIGRPDDYEKACKDYKDIFNEK